MPTAIEKINEAEKKADDIRLKALEKSREDMRSAQDFILKHQKEKILKARLEARKKLEDIEAQINAEMDMRIDEYKKKHEEYKKTVMVNVEKASNLIVKRILDI